MANSVIKLRNAAVTPLGFVKVVTPGTPVCIMVNIDPGNNNAPTKATGPWQNPYGADVPYSPSCRGFGFQGYKQASPNTPPVANTGNVYILTAPGGGSGNNIDTGAMVKVLASTFDYFYPPEGANLDRTSPYYIFLDADNAGDGAIVVAYGASGGG